MEYNFQVIDNPKIKKMTDQQQLHFKEYVWVSPKVVPDTALGKDWQPKPCVLVPQYEGVADKIKHFQVRKDDVWLVTYPKTGTTWCQEMIWLLGNKLDFEKAKTTDVYERFPFFEIEGITGPDAPGFMKFEEIENMPSPRFIKTHLPASLLPDQLWTIKPKIFYVRRNPKDTAVSYFHHHRILQGYTGNMHDFMEAFIDDLVLWSPFHEHVMEFCQMAKTESNIHLIRFEDMKKNLFKVIEKTAQFMSIDLPTNKMVQLKDHLSFNSMRDNSSINHEKLIVLAEMMAEMLNPDAVEGEEGSPPVPKETKKFLRKGQVGGWKDEMEPKHAEQIDEMTKMKANTEELAKLFAEN